MMMSLSVTRWKRSASPYFQQQACLPPAPTEKTTLPSALILSLKTYHSAESSPPDPDRPAPNVGDRRLARLEQNEPKRQLIRDVRVLCKLRKITQGKMAEEIGIPKRTLEEWMQYR